MKKFIVLIAILFATSFTGVKAQYTSAISIDPLDFLISKVVNATYEYRLSENNSLTLSASYYAYSDYWKAFGIGGSYRWYLSDVLRDEKEPIEGLSVGPMVRLSFWTFDGADPLDVVDDGAYIVIGGEAAYKYNFAPNWFVEPIIRIGFAVTDLEYLGYDPIGGGINLGYNW